MQNETVRINVPDIPVKVCEEAKQRIGMISGLHYHDEIEFIPVYDGEFICVVDGKRYTAHAGQTIFINSGVPHSTYCFDEGTRSGLIQFRTSDFMDIEVTGIIRYSLRFAYYTDEPVRILDSKDIFRSAVFIINEFGSRGVAYTLMIKSAVIRLLALLYREGILTESYHSLTGVEAKKIMPALEYINENYSEALTLDGVSARLGFDKSYFCRIFKKAVGATFTQYLNFVRVCKAEKMLTHTEDSILEISEKIGYSSVSYFNREFKRYKSCSPTVYRMASCSTM